MDPSLVGCIGVPHNVHEECSGSDPFFGGPPSFLALMASVVPPLGSTEHRYRHLSFNYFSFFYVLSFLYVKNVFLLFTPKAIIDLLIFVCIFLSNFTVPDLISTHILLVLPALAT